MGKMNDEALLFGDDPGFFDDISNETVTYHDGGHHGANNQQQHQHHHPKQEQEGGIGSQSQRAKKRIRKRRRGGPEDGSETNPLIDIEDNPWVPSRDDVMNEQQQEATYLNDDDFIRDNNALNNEAGDNAAAWYDQRVEDMKQRRKRKYEGIAPGEAENRAENIINEMIAAADADQQAWEDRRPGTAKLQLMDRVCGEITKPRLESYFMQMNVLTVFERYLSVLPDRSLPNNKIRQDLLDVLLKLKINADDLQGTELGHKLVDLWKHPEENENNKKKIQKIIQNVLRPLLGLSGGFRGGGH